MVHLVLREIEASQEKMEVLESKALLGLPAHQGRRVLLVFRDTRDHQASQDQKAPRDPQENRVIQESQDHKGPQELMEEKDQGALLAKLVGWGLRVSLG